VQIALAKIALAAIVIVKPKIGLSFFENLS
jgi:hypothetical protein